MDNKIKIKEAADTMISAIRARENFQDLIMGDFLTGKEILKKYSVAELNRKFLSDDELTSKIIDPKTSYFVTENSLLSLSKNSHAGLYRHHTWLDFKTEIDSDGKLCITICYKTQSDSSDTVHTGNKIQFYYENGRLFSRNIDIKETKFQEFEIITNGNSFVLDKNNKIHAIISQNSICKGEIESKINRLELARFVAEKMFKYSDYLIATEKSKDYQIIRNSTELYLSDITKIDLTDKVKKLTLNNCSSSIKIPSSVNELDLHNTKSEIPKTIKRLSLLDTGHTVLDTNEYPNLTFLYIHDNDMNIIVSDKLKTLHINKGVIDKVPTRYFDFNWSRNVWFGYSDIYLRVNGTEDHREYGRKLFNLSTPDKGKTFVAEDAWGNDVSFGKKELLKKYEHNSIIKEWVENLYNPTYYVEKLKKELLSKITHTYTQFQSIEPKTFHTYTIDFNKIKPFNILIREGKKYVVNSVTPKNKTMALIPFEKRFEHSIKDVIQVTTTDRIECLMIDLFEENRIPYRGWKKRVFNYTVSKERFVPLEDKEFPIINEQNIYDILNTISKEKFDKHNGEEDEDMDEWDEEDIDEDDE